jgi:hypothetical protein
MRRRAVPRPWRERNKGHAHLRPNTMTERHTQPLREGKKKRDADDRNRCTSLPKPTRRHCAPQPMLEVSQCRFRTKDKEEEREREQREEVAIPDPTRTPTKNYNCKRTARRMEIDGDRRGHGECTTPKRNHTWTQLPYHEPR